MAKRYRLRLTEETDDQREPERVVVGLDGDGGAVASWLLSIADTITRDDPYWRETLHRQAVVLVQHLERERRLEAQGSSGE